ncbi:TonB-dependent receptor [Fulvivirga sp. M361]|uniref:outer membrane beta-barrel family protein n=1 Tax=Fulvivirga sp. M361 TaxID=2594266 RepID=UPI00117BBFCE|nr:outer membrane beta-barrel family protein [Fulvivirga sp. M361]TRX47061.1 TonB-dependent receptor [Fulvivirga sp. M361]
MNPGKTTQYLTSLLFTLIFGLHCVRAQNRTIEIVGVVKEEQSEQPIPFATVAIRDNETRMPVTGTTTDSQGQFKILSEATAFYVEVSFLGFTNKLIDDISIINGQVDLGTIFLSEDRKVLDEVVVAGQRSRTEFQVDKRVFNVGDDLSSTGMGALEVLNNVPSVNVSIEGEVSLRGSTGVQILIDGKPSILSDEQSNALGTITADMIEKIEVITNPSAKYDAEGTSGILNIVLKKEEKKGLNGSVSLNTGIPDNHSIGISLNRRTEKFNLFTQLGAGYRSLPRYSETTNRDLINNTTIESDGEAFRNETFYNIILGTDYHINANNVITLSGNFAYEIEDQPSDTDFSFFDETNTLLSQRNRIEVTDADNPKWQYELQYKKDFEDHKEHSLVFSALGRFFGKDQSSEFTNTATFGNEEYADQQTQTKFQQADYTFKLDYTDPITDKITLETGAQYVINNVGNDYAVFNLVDNSRVVDENLTNDFEFDQKVLGVYGTGAYKFEDWGVKLGLRIENTDLNTLLINTNESNDQNYTNLFPSAHTSYKFDETFSLQAGYSRRIYRPRLWDLNPFFNIRNDFNIRTGNPNLQPEFTDSYEVTGIFIEGKMALNAGVYYRYTTDVIERVSFFENNVNTTTPLNIGSNAITGFEVNLEYDLTKWMSLNGDFNYNYFKREGNLESTTFDFNGDRSNARLTTKFKLPADIDIEIVSNYRSGYQTVQSVVSNTAFMDIGLRKKFLDKKAVVNLSIRDVFASRIQESITEQPEFFLYNFNQRGRFITLGFSYGFGKGEAMTYSGGKR